MLMKCAQQLVVIKENRAKDENDDTKQASGGFYFQCDPSTRRSSKS